MLIGLFEFFSLNWQHQLCKHPRPNPDIKTLFTDHSCSPTANGSRPPPTNNPLVGPIPKAGAFPPIGAHGVSIFLLSICMSVTFLSKITVAIALFICSHFSLLSPHLLVLLLGGCQALILL